MRTCEKSSPHPEVNPGSPSEAGLALDARAANQWVREDTPEHPVVHHYRLTPPPILLRDRYASNERIESVAAPILVIAGSEDSIVPLSQSRELYELAPTPKELGIVRGADHNDPELVAGPEVIEAIDRFVDRASDGQR